jgi:hypothetical protein
MRAKPLTANGRQPRTLSGRVDANGTGERGQAPLWPVFSTLNPQLSTVQRLLVATSDLLCRLLLTFPASRLIFIQIYAAS